MVEGLSRNIVSGQNQYCTAKFTLGIPQKFKDLLRDSSEAGWNDLNTRLD